MAYSAAKGSGGKGHGGGGKSQDSPDTILSKKMSQVLRHTAKELGLPMTPDGYVCIEDMLAVQNGRMFAGYTEADIVRIVMQNDKQRFSLSEDERARRTVGANQGHSGSTAETVDDESLLEEVQDVAELNRRGEVCVHGTYWAAWELIQKEGLKPMTRSHVHFAPRCPGSGEVISGMRTTSQVLIYLDTSRALEAGMRIFRSRNGVLLTRGLNGAVAPEFFQQAVQRYPHKLLWKPERPVEEKRIPGLPQPDTTEVAAKSRRRATKPDPEPVPECWDDETCDAETPVATCEGDQAVEAPAVQAAAGDVSDSRAQVEKEVRKLEKILKQIEALEEKQTKGAALEAEALAKVARRPGIEEQLGELRAQLSAPTSPAAPASTPTPAEQTPAAASTAVRAPVRAAPAPAPARTVTPAPAVAPSEQGLAEAGKEPSSRAVGATTKVPTPAAEKGAKQSASLGAAPADPAVLQKELRGLEKKLKQIEALEQKIAAGTALDADAAEKVARKSEFEQRSRELRALL